MQSTLDVLLSLTGDEGQIKSVFHGTGITKQVLRIAVNFEESKASPSNQSNIKAYQILINLTEHDPIIQELVEINCAPRIAEHVRKLYERYPKKATSKENDDTLELAIATLGNITRFYIGMDSLLELSKAQELHCVNFLKFIEIYLKGGNDSRLDYMAAVIANCCVKPEVKKAFRFESPEALKVLVKNLPSTSPIRMVYTLMMMENLLIDKTEMEWVINSKAYLQCLYASILLCAGARDAAFISYWIQKEVQIQIVPEVEDKFKVLSEEHANNIRRHALECLIAMASNEAVKIEMEKYKASSVVSVLLEKNKVKELDENLVLLNSKLV